MRKEILFVQGAGQSTHDDWDDKLVRSLERELGDDYVVRYPRMPNEAEPKYSAWRRALLKELAQLKEGAIVVGHSVGGTMLLHVLAERVPDVALAAIALIAAPFIGQGGWPSDELETRDDFDERLPAALPVFLYHGTADGTVPIAHLALYAKAIPQATLRRLTGRDHQLNDDLREVARDIEALPAGQ